MLIQCPRTTLHRKIISNVVLIYSYQNCAKNLPVQCWPRFNKLLFLVKQTIQCCVYQAGKTLHRKIIYSFFSKYIWDNIAQENYMYNIGPECTAMKENSLHNFVLVCLGQDCTKQQPVQCRNSHQRCSVKKGVLKYFAIFTGKHLCWSFFLIKLGTFRAAPQMF